MGSINYGLNNHFHDFQIGLHCMANDFDELEKEYLFDDINYLLEKNDFNYYDIKLLFGYYDGFYLSISFKWYYYDNYNDKKENLKELNKLYKLLLELIQNYNMRFYTPGWVTAFYNENESISALKEAIEKERNCIKKAHTLYTIKKNNLKFWEVERC